MKSSYRVGTAFRWPPSGDDLRIMYVDEGLSARRIARVFGVSRTAVHHALKEQGIKTRSREEILGNTPARLLGRLTESKEDENELRRLYVEEGLTCLQIGQRLGLKGSTDTLKKVVSRRLRKARVELRRPEPGKYDILAPDWARRYQAGESTVKIARGLTYPSVVFNYLDRLGIKHRNNSENITRYRKAPFSGTELDKAYLSGFARGDLCASRLHRLLQVATGTTHPAMLDLVTSLFTPYGPVHLSPVLSPVAGFEWRVVATVDLTFEFLLERHQVDPYQTFNEESLFSYLAGLFDAEGYLWLQSNGRFSPFWGICNSDSTMLDWVMDFLERRGFHPCRIPPRVPDGLERVHVLRPAEVARLVQLLPLRHPEKKAKVRMVLDQRILPQAKRMHWLDLNAQIRSDRDEMTKLAERELATKSRGATNNVFGLMACLRYLSHMRKFPLNQSIWVETLSWLGEFVEDEASPFFPSEVERKSPVTI